jgi:hypothetical protein
MKTLKVIFSIILITISSQSLAVTSHRISGHFKRSGTYVAPYRATNPNRTQRDNWSSIPNANPYTGKRGTKKPRY